MASFLPSLALVLVAQLPLLLKLWLDYRAKTAGLRQEVHKRQLDTFQVLISKLIPLNDKLCAVASVYPDSRIFDSHPESKEAARHVYRTALDAYMAFHDESVRAELLLPADLSIVISEYSQGATRIISTAMNLRPELNHSRPDLTLLYKQQEARFNQAFNIMRLSSGIDALTSSVVRDVHSGEVVRLLQRSMTYL